MKDVFRGRTAELEAYYFRRIMNITINRDSVCMGDDAFNHKQEIILPEDAQYEDLYEELKKQSYFPHINGNNVVWVLCNKKYSCIFSYFTYDDTFHCGLSEKKISNIDDGTHCFHLNYYSSPEKWKKSFSRWYNNNMKDLHHDGWDEEIQHCDALSGMFME